MNETELRADRETGPARFLQDDVEQRPRRVASSVLSAVLLLLLVVGVPAGLLALDAAPAIPRSLPSPDALTGTIGVEQLLAVLVWIVWLAWLQFTICTVVELRSALSGVGLPARVPLAGPSQRLARTLVVSVLLLASAAGQASAAVAPSAPVHSEVGVAISAPAVAGEVAATVAAPAEAQAAQGETTYWLGDVQLSPEEGAELLGKRVYVVKVPDGRYHDNLWDIAERTLGDGRRYSEVFELNKGRDQPDGHELTLERLIYPNWLLVMPEDAAGVERVTAVVTPVAPAPEAPAPVTPAPLPEHAPVLDGTQPLPAADVHESSSSTALLVGGGLLAVGLLAALDRLRRRNRTGEPSDDAVELEVALRVGADPRRALLLDRGLRQLAAAHRATGRPLPGVVAAVVSDDALELRLSPSRPDAPAPWQAAADGTTWRLAADDVDGAQAGGPAPFPGLVSLGRDALGRDVLLDLESAQGPVSVVGDPQVAREVATALAAELATNRWSDGLRVTGVDLPDGLDALPGGRYARAASASDVLDRLGGRRVGAHDGDVLSGRVRPDGATTWVPEYLVLGAAPTGALAEQVVAIATTDRRSPLGVVCVGDLPGARWQLVAQPDGRLVARLLGLDVQSNRLTPRQVGALGELFTEAPEPAPALDARHDAVAHEGAVERPDVAAPVRPRTPDDLTAAPVRVLVLGEPRVESLGVLDEDRRALLTELVVFLALHPEGVHANVLAAALWPGGVTAEVREATLERAARWLGTDASGRPRLVRRADGRVALGPEAVVDWDVVTTLLARSRSATSPQAERADLAAALELAHGTVLSVRPSGRYAWLARVRLERASRALLVDAVHRLVVLCHHDDDPGAAQAAAWAGLRLAPTEELLWRDLMRAAALVGGPDAVRQAAGDLAATLRTAGVHAMSPATRAVVEDLAPQPSEAGGSGA
ncbi:hypothetical protein GXP71_18960 [Cellulomonas sp. H30R-01]|uniref:hypothetical protein n=1 Tax=Cellulomonas sp. H30R-01 TaxID=2704467 RepID=UPI00138D5BA3|nr:hypothetical protein [Cellulomonas sp. H30R-01]QHT57957.1 hypothetical protein GXP71_18960 [Cellulomonas sp. H30R-01]